MRENRWHPPLQPKPPVGFVRMRYCFVNETIYSESTIMQSKLHPTNPIVMSKMLLPTEEETAMSPNPLRATMTDVIKSGTEVPAAKKESPIIWILDIKCIDNNKGLHSTVNRRTELPFTRLYYREITSHLDPIFFCVISATFIRTASLPLF